MKVTYRQREAVICGIVGSAIIWSGSHVASTALFISSLVPNLYDLSTAEKVVDFVVFPESYDFVLRTVGLLAIPFMFGTLTTSGFLRWRETKTPANATKLFTTLTISLLAIAFIMFVISTQTKAIRLAKQYKLLEIAVLANAPEAAPVFKKRISDSKSVAEVETVLSEMQKLLQQHPLQYVNKNATDKSSQSGAGGDAAQ